MEKSKEETESIFSKVSLKQCICLSDALETYSKFTSICISPKGNEIIVNDPYTSKILVLGLEGKRVKSIECKAHPHEICVFGSHLLVANLYSIDILDQEYNLVSSIELGDDLKSIGAVCWSKEGNIIVSTKEDSILILSRDGKILKKFTRFAHNGGISPYKHRICIDSNDRIITIDQRNQGISIRKLGRYSLFVFGLQGSEPGQVDSPQGVCVDEHDNILVADSGNKRISIFTSYGIHITQIPTPETPCGLCVKGQALYVIGEKSIFVFDI